MLRAAVGLGLDKGSRSAAAAHLDDSSSPLSHDDLAEERENVMGLPSSSTSRGSSPLYNKHAVSDYQDHNLDTTAPSSPCTPSMHMRSLSAVSPTSSRSEEAAFQHHQLSLEADSRVTAAAASQSTRPGVAAHGGTGGSSGAGNTSGRFGLKLLVSNSMAGTLIGKGGTRICEIKDEVRWIAFESHAVQGLNFKSRPVKLAMCIELILAAVVFFTREVSVMGHRYRYRYPDRCFAC